MVYIVVLNWNGWRDTVACVESLMSLDHANYKIIICDNDSSDDSVKQLVAWYNKNKEKFEYLQQADFQYLEGEEISNYKSQAEKGVYLLQTGSNLGYAGGNNIGLRFALQQADMEYSWILNNDTEIPAGALSPLVLRCEGDSSIAICGSRMVYFDDRDKQQGVGGVFNKYLATTKHVEGGVNPNKVYCDKELSKKIDYVIGASMFITKNSLLEVGLLCEEYFLYYEELDYALRAKEKGYNLSVASTSIVYHKEGATICKSNSSDFYFVRNRLTITRKFYKRNKIYVRISLLLVFLNRLRRTKFVEAINVLKIFFGKKEL